ncbi:capsule assembly Wzi family protein [Mucilaginibacter xinganensis]|uniref:Capsule assembly protein, Wzi n=1 Tax=Mucilaginibacter xinganensis TaxID=1234841 RepID=A0A223NUN0_9SPHI|nr:capsule assembly Wzi family protein [Mucilaginibacter xinganensis]ASU33338.1 capsule assembly protein, Wzi [Mucilaginibacter xinganensis]
MQKTLTLVAAFVLLFSGIAKAQDKDIHVSLEAQGGYTSGNTVPFWLRANRFGNIPLSGGSGSFLAKFRKDYDSTKTFDWGASFEGRGNFGKSSQFILIEGLIKARAGIFEIKAGRSKDVVGIADTTLSSGSFSVSGNALGVPKIKISIPNYYSIPAFGKLFAIKAGMANGYIGTTNTNLWGERRSFKSYYLEEYLYARIGKPDWRFKLQAGFNHEAVWGDEKQVFGSFYKLNGLQTYWYVLSGKVYNSSKVGNHLGSADIAAEYKFDALTLSVYRQNFYDIGALIHFANIADGLNGISLVNNMPKSGSFYWKKLVFEFLYTKNQAGYPSSKATKSGEEDYYNNYEYVQGWSYKGLGLGTPFITPAYYARQKFAPIDRQFFTNNRVSAVHLAAEVSAFNWSYTGKVSYSQNYGTYANGSEVYRVPGGQLAFPSAPVPFVTVHQTSLYLESSRPLKNNYTIGYEIGYDRGGLLYNSFGLILKVSKSFL